MKPADNNAAAQPRCKVFLLSPAHAGGKRALLLLREGAKSALARRLRSEGAPLGEVFAFVSGLYFRGKLAYAERFSSPPSGMEGAYVITSGLGLLSCSTVVDFSSFIALGKEAICETNPFYRSSLTEAAQMLQTKAGEAAIILLGSVASPKYTSILFPVFNRKLYYPTDFIGRGDMSRGSLMLQAAASGRELHYSRCIDNPDIERLIRRAELKAKMIAG